MTDEREPCPTCGAPATRVAQSEDAPRWESWLYCAPCLATRAPPDRGATPAESIGTAIARHLDALSKEP